MKTILSEGRYFGCCDRARTVGALVVSMCRYAPRAYVPRHAHENPYFIFALSGGQEESFGTRNRTYRASTMAFHPAGESHSETVGSAGLRCLHVEFRPEWLRRHPEVSRHLSNPSEFQGGNLAWLAKRVHREFCLMDDVAPAAIEGLVLEILAMASRRERAERPGDRPRWLTQAEELIRARFAEALSLSDVADAVGVHPVRLARAFRQKLNCSVGEFIRKVRVESACQALLSESNSLSEVGLAAGFADQAHFARTFKRFTGQTPGQFRATRAG